LQLPKILHIPKLLTALFPENAFQYNTTYGVRCDDIRNGTAVPAVMSQVQFQVLSLEFFLHENIPTAWIWRPASVNTSEYQDYLLGVKVGFAACWLTANFALTFSTTGYLSV